MLSARGVAKSLGGAPVLAGVDLELGDSAVVRIAGANGTGKSTLLRCVAGLWPPDAGDIELFGASVVWQPSARRRLGYAPDVFAPFPALSVLEMLRLVAALKQARPPSDEQCARLGADEFLQQPVAALSAGQQRRAALLAALIGDPWLLVLDEPTNGLDAAGVEQLVALLAERRRRDQATLLVTHDPSFADAVGAASRELRDGRLAS